VEDPCGDERESRDAGGVAARECALGFRAAARWARWPGALEDQSRCPYRDPTGNRRGGDRRTTAPASESPRQEESGRDVAARKSEQLERRLRDLDASIVVASRPIIGSAIERRRLVERSDGAEGAQCGERRAKRRCIYTRAESTRAIHARAKLHDACYCEI